MIAKAKASGAGSLGGRAQVEARRSQNSCDFGLM